MDSDWWREAIRWRIERKTPRSRAEDLKLSNRVKDMRIKAPTNVTEFKNPPIFVLQRHLLKFEAVFPADTPPSGFFGKNKEPYYPRDSVFTLHTREFWVKEALWFGAAKSRRKWPKRGSSTTRCPELPCRRGRWSCSDTGRLEEDQEDIETRDQTHNLYGVGPQLHPHQHERDIRVHDPALGHAEPTRKV